MSPGFPIRVNGIEIRTAEALYQACRFPRVPQVQRLIISEPSPMTAKMKSKPYRDEGRSDWNAVRVRVMRWCLRVKLAQNWEAFGQLLLQTHEMPIVEDSRKDDFWGAKRTENGVLTGRNVLGRLLMELRAISRAEPQQLAHVEPPRVRDCLLFGEPIRAVERAYTPST
jgi:type I restriction enzyme S subunit